MKIGLQFMQVRQNFGNHIAHRSILKEQPNDRSPANRLGCNQSSAIISRRRIDVCSLLKQKPDYIFMNMRSIMRVLTKNSCDGRLQRIAKVASLDIDISAVVKQSLANQ